MRYETGMSESALLRLLKTLSPVDKEKAECADAASVSQTFAGCDDLHKARRKAARPTREGARHSMDASALKHLDRSRAVRLAPGLGVWPTTQLSAVDKSTAPTLWPAALDS